MKFSITLPFRSLLVLTALLACANVQACFILFYHNEHHTLVGNHEDWFAKDAAVLINPPAPGKYGSVVFTFLSEGWAQGGMNDQGLFFDGAYTPFQEVSFDSHVKAFPGYIWQSVLDKCRNVEEALEFISKYELPDLEESHIVLADAEGNSVILGVENGKLAVKKKQGEYLLQTNFNPWHPELSDEPVFNRYESAHSYLSEQRPMSEQDIRSILKLTHQNELTVYSNIYDLRKRTITTFNKIDFENPITLSLDDIFKKGNCLVSLDSLAADREYPWDCSGTETTELTLKGEVRDESGEPLPFASIGIPGTDIGTISDPDGTWELSIPSDYQSDSVQFSSIGYVSRKMRPADLKSSSNVVLSGDFVMLDEVVISEKKRYKMGRLGYMKGRDGSVPFDTIQGGGAVAMLLETPETPFYVDKIQLRLMYNSKDTLQFRLHFFKYDSVCDCPGQELLEKEIILKEQQRFGWMKFDLRKEEIRLNESRFFVGYEWLDDRKTRDQMVIGLKDWSRWKEEEFLKGNEKVVLVEEQTWSINNKTNKTPAYYKYNGNMMNWPGWDLLPPFTGLMVETGKNEKTKNMRTFERRTSFGTWKEKNTTLNTVVIISY